MSLGHNVVTVVEQAANPRHQALFRSDPRTIRTKKQFVRIYPVLCTPNTPNQNGTPGKGPVLCGQGQEGQTRAVRIRAFAPSGWRHRYDGFACRRLDLSLLYVMRIACSRSRKAVMTFFWRLQRLELPTTVCVTPMFMSCVRSGVLASTPWFLDMRYTVLQKSSICH